MDKYYPLLFLFILTINCTIQDDIVDDYVEPEIRITTNPPNELILQGNYQFSASFVNDVGDTGELLNQSITWNSSNTSVITIDTNGLATAVGTGSSIISASALNNNPKDEQIITKEIATINVKNGTKPLEITNKITSLTIGNNYQYTFNYSGDSTIIWSSSQTSVATINTSGLLTPIAAGITTITTSTIENGITVTDTTIIEVIENATISGVLSGSYGLKGTVSIKDSELIFSDDFNVNTAPGGYFYLSNNPTSLTGSILVSGKITARSGAWTLPLNNVGNNDYKYIIFWCEPFSAYLGGAEFK